jgi:RNA polymerase sigma factor (sigma-70 family)
VKQDSGLENDLQIWLNIKNGDVAALKELYQQFYQVLFNYGRKMTKEQVLIEDAIQETFISIWRYRDTSSIPVSLKGYLLKSFRHEVIKILKHQSFVENSEEVIDFNFEISFDQKIIEGENAQQLSSIINNALSKLTNRQREIIYYRFYEGLSFQEIADLMNLQTRATYKLTARALGTLKDLLGKRVFLIVLPLLN